MISMSFPGFGVLHYSSVGCQHWGKLGNRSIGQSVLFLQLLMRLQLFQNNLEVLGGSFLVPSG